MKAELHEEGKELVLWQSVTAHQFYAIVTLLFVTGQAEVLYEVECCEEWKCISIPNVANVNVANVVNVHVMGRCVFFFICLF